MYCDDRTFAPDTELRVRHDRPDLDDSISIRVQTRHFEVNPDEIVRLRRHVPGTGTIAG
jgi:hypothetical protein